MKQFLKLGLGTLLLNSGFSYAVNPAQGPYAGLLLGGSASPSIHFTFIDPTTLQTNTGKLKYSGFGNIGGQLGYRFGQMRAELELLYNSAPYKSLQFGPYIIKSPKADLLFRMKGSTGTGAAMVNGYYDFFTAGNDCNVAPYVGLGIGYAHIKNSIKFYFNNIEIIGSHLSKSANAVAAQGIIGGSYFLDDYTSFSLDYRYLTTKKVNSFNSRLIVNSINLTFTGSLDCF